MPTGWPSSRNRNEGSVRRGSTRPAATSCGISKMWIGGKSRSSASRSIDVGQGGVGGAEVDADFHALHSLADVEFQLPAAAVAGDAPELQHAGFGDHGFEATPAPRRPTPSVAGRFTSIGRQLFEIVAEVLDQVARRGRSCARPSRRSGTPPARRRPGRTRGRGCRRRCLPPCRTAPPSAP